LPWGPIVNDSIDAQNDDLFPNLASRKTAMYRSPNEALTAGFDEGWTMVVGHGIIAATSPGQKSILQEGNMRFGESSEWEATAFNNGRRIVRDSNGYFHAFWHSIRNKRIIPNGTGCDIMYSYTLKPAAEPPPMDAQGQWVPPINMTINLNNMDNRYPSVAVEYEIWDNNWSGFNTLHVVWQASVNGPNGPRYDVYYANIPVVNPPVAPLPWGVAINLSNTPLTDSLVPAIAINKYNPNSLNQHLHVVWQEEDINNNNGLLPPPQEDAWFSDIAYIRSVNSGVNWAGPGGGWNGNVWDNLTRTAANSQMPSIACTLDRNTGVPHQVGRSEFGYNSDDVHVTYNEIVGAGMHVYYLRSLNDGVNWNPRVDVTLAAGGAAGTMDAYSNIVVDMLDNPHIVFMRNAMAPREPMHTGPNIYRPGVDPTLWWSFPGPDIGMYGVRVNSIVYAYFNGNVWTPRTWNGPDMEFPTVSLDRWQHATVNWQQYVNPDYDIMRVTNRNLNAPAFPLLLQNYQGWAGISNDSNDPNNDDLFPSLAFKKTAMYMSPNEQLTAGFDEIWTKVFGHGRFNAMAPMAKEVGQKGNMTYGP
jgi:hypothetical protein